MLDGYVVASISRTPQGVRGLKQPAHRRARGGGWSHSARSAWIETVRSSVCIKPCPGRTPQGVRGLKLFVQNAVGSRAASHSARSAWIETNHLTMHLDLSQSHSARSAWIETLVPSPVPLKMSVALRKECVD